MGWLVTFIVIFWGAVVYFIYQAIFINNYAAIIEKFQILVGVSLTGFTAICVSVIAFAGTTSSARVAKAKDKKDREEKEKNNIAKIDHISTRILKDCEAAIANMEKSYNKTSLEKGGIIIPYSTADEYRVRSPQQLKDIWQEIGVFHDDVSCAIREMTSQIESAEFYIDKCSKSGPPSIDAGILFKKYCGALNSSQSIINHFSIKRKRL